MERNTVYLAGDVDAIKDFVFETSSLPQIRGGSELLQECEEEIRRRFGNAVIYCAGGSFLLEVPAHRAEEIRKEIEGIYREKTLVATVTIVAEQNAPPWPAASPQPNLRGWADRLWQATKDVPLDGGFAHRLAFLQSQMQEAKTARTAAPFYEALPFGRRCERCGRRMAQDQEQVGGKSVCVVCKLRYEKGRKREGETEIRGRFNREFWERYGEAIQADQPKDLDTMLQPVSRKYLAFLYADGNDIGKLFRRIDQPNHYKAISDALTGGTREALYRALWETCEQELQRKDRPWPFEIINIGGDDVVVLLQAGYAWEAAVRFLEYFEAEVNSRLESVWSSTETRDRITASCGIAIADVKYPVRYLERLAADLLKEAKKRAKENPKDRQSAVTFLWLTSPVASEKVEPLRGFYRIGRDLYLTARPYTLDEARTLREVAWEMRRWPRATRHRWAEALQKGVLVSLNFIQYDVAREGATGKEMRECLAKLSSVMEARSRGAPGALPIWHQVEEGGEILWRTPLLDALELAELDTMRPDVEEEE